MRMYKDLVANYWLDKGSEFLKHIAASNDSINHRYGEPLGLMAIDFQMRVSIRIRSQSLTF